MKHIRIIVVLSLILQLGGAAFYKSNAEPLEFIYEHYSIENGLPHNSISDICQDSRGYLWLSTWYGLSRFDGSGFVNYTMLPGDYSNLSHNRILSLLFDLLFFLKDDFGGVEENGDHEEHIACRFHNAIVVGIRACDLQNAAGNAAEG